MTKPVRFTPLAIADIEGLHRHIEMESPQQAERFEEQVALTIDDLAAFPESRALLRHHALSNLNLRRSIIRGFPNHLVVYSFDGEGIAIDRAFHAAQDWMKDLLTLDL